MKKIILTLAVLFVAVSASAQTWGVGGRVGSGLQAVGEYKFENGNYIEARFGLGLKSKYGYRTVISADFTALYQWNVLNMDWTPNAGQWSLDAGVGVNVGGNPRVGYIAETKGPLFYCGVAGGVKLGFTFKNTPIKLAVDWTPSVGPVMYHNQLVSEIAFNAMALSDFGISCVYYF